jgi:hypothetical protein
MPPISEGRPRLLAAGEDFERVSQLLDSDDRASTWFDQVEARGERILDEPPEEYELPDGKRLLAVSRAVRDRSFVLGTLYRLTGEERYAERLWEEFDAVADYRDWNPSHFLDVAEMTVALAVGYDWLYDYWSDGRRRRIGNAIVEFGLRAGQPAYDDSMERPDGFWWVDVSSNWASVCHGGLSIGAFALLGEEGYPADLLRLTVEGAREYVENPITGFGPNGGYEEGVMYWGYNSRYLVYYLSSVVGTFESDYGLLEFSQLRNIGDFPIFMTSTLEDYHFAFGDGSGWRRPREPILQWLAAQFDRPDYARFQWKSLEMADGSAEPLDLLWYDPSVASAGIADRPLDRHFPGGDHSATFRSAWDDTSAAFLGFKAGHNQSAHGDLDVGTFVFDDRGVRWARDQGAYGYSEVEPEFWDRGADGDRWNFYRKRAEGHNTLVVDPGESPDQDPLAECEIETFQSTSDAGVAITDTSAAYPSANGVRRGVRLDDNRSTLTVQDEIGADGAEVWWFMHTEASVDTSGRTATLERGGESLQAAIISPAEASFEVREAAPLPSSPTPLQNGEPIPEVDQPIEGVRKLAINLADVTDTTLAVRLGRDVDPSGEPSSLEDWIDG